MVVRYGDEPARRRGRALLLSRQNGRLESTGHCPVPAGHSGLHRVSGLRNLYGHAELRRPLHRRAGPVGRALPDRGRCPASARGSRVSTRPAAVRPHPRCASWLQDGAAMIILRAQRSAGALAAPSRIGIIGEGGRQIGSIRARIAEDVQGRATTRRRASRRLRDRQTSEPAREFTGAASIGPDWFLNVDFNRPLRTGRHYRASRPRRAPPEPPDASPSDGILTSRWSSPDPAAANPIRPSLSTYTMSGEVCARAANCSAISSPTPF
jgi:hypothetical protein